MTVRLQDEQAIFETARKAKSPELRQAFLDVQCGNDAELKQRISSLLRAHEESESFLESPPPELIVRSNLESRTIEYSLSERPGTVIGPYKLLQQIGEGGMGVVFMSEQTEPIQRSVALKIIKPGMDTRQVIARFEAERQALAMMDHPNIAKVLDAGTTDSGRPYFVMELVKGVPITKYCDEKHLSLRARLELLLPVCQAVQHAHQKGVIHRDIKPTNVLVAEYDDHAVPKVIDFGVAKATAQKLTEHTMFTEFGQVVGTVEYMSPEQAKLNQLDIDTRSDIYSLGVLLYELLTGSTPFVRKRLQEAAFDEMLRIIREEEPPKPSTRLSTTDGLPSIAASRGSEPKKLSGLVKGELDWIVMKALEKDRNRRYETANGFAADIQRYLHDEPVQACSPSATYRLRKFALRNKAAFLTAGLIAALLVVAIMSLSISNARFRRESAAKQVALQQKDVALQEKVVALGDKNQALAVTREKESLAQSRLYAAQMSLAQRAWEGGERARTVELLETLRPHENEPDRRGFEWSYLYSLSHPNLLRTWRAHDSIVNGVAWSPDGAMFATCNEHNGVRFWDGRTGEHLGDLPVEDPDNWDLAFSPDGELLATAGGTLEGRLVVWDVPTKRKLWQHKAHPVPFGIRALAISPDSRVIATCAWDGPSNPNFGTTKLWNAKDGELLATLRDQKGGVYRVAFSRDGKLLATAGASWEKDTRICLWDLKLPTVAKRWEVKNVGAAGFSFSEDGQTLFAGNIGGVQLIDVPTGKLGYTLGEPPSEYSVVRQVPGKKQIVSASLDRTLRLWDLETRDSVPLGAELASVTAMAIDPKGERIACGDEHGWVSLRTLAEPKVPPSFHGIGVIKSISFAPDGRSLVAAGSPLSVLDRSTLEVLATGPDKVLAISPDNMLAAIYDPADQRCTIWNIKSREHGRSMEVGAIHQARFSPDGKQLATWARWESPILQLWNTDSGERIERLKPYAFSVMSVAFSPDGRYLAAALQFNEIGVYDLAKKTWSIHNFSNGFQCANVVEYSPQGNTLAAGVVQGGAILFDVHPQSGALKLRSRLSGITQGVNAIAFNPDGLSLVTAGADGSVRFSDTATGQERGTITMAAKSLAFSPNGKQLAIADDKGTVRVLVAGPNAAMEQKSDR